MSQTPTEFMKVYERTTNSHDLEATLELIDENAVYFFSNKSVHIRKPAIRRAIERNLRLISDDSYSLNNIHWLVATDDVCVCVYDFAWSGLVDGSPASGSGRGTSVIKRHSNTWRVIHEHLSVSGYLVSGS